MISNILFLVCPNFVSFVMQIETWLETWYLNVSYMVSYMNSYMDFYIILGHFLWHERFRTVHERFRTVQKSFECWNKSLLRACLICPNLLRTYSVMQKYWSLGRVEESLLLSAVALMYGPCLCSHLSSEISVCFPLDCDCVTLPLLLSLPIFYNIYIYTHIYTHMQYTVC